tara:strand:+ start:20 stop:574 length:555 start_codon:yes stop_codon:yes gene_type:complete
VELSVNPVQGEQHAVALHHFSDEVLIMNFSIGEGSGKFVTGIAPVDIDAGAQTSEAWDTSRYNKTSIVVMLGVTGAASTITLEECTAADGSGATAIGFAYYAEETAGGDQTGARQTASASGFATSTNDGVFYVLEVASEELSDGSNFLRMKMTDPGAATFCSVGIIQTGARYAEVEALTTESVV